MRDNLEFVNNVAYMSVGPQGEIISRGELHNVTGYRTRDQVLKALTTPPSTSPGTLVQIGMMYFRVDGLTTLGSFAQWDSGNATAFSTRLSSGTYITSVQFNATYTATANVSCKAVALVESSQSGPNDVGSFARFWSTTFNMACGSAGKLIVQWTVSMP